VGLGPGDRRLGCALGGESERLRFLITMHTRGERWINDGDGFGVLVLGVVFLRMDLLVFLQVLGALERLFAYITDVRFERSMD
jgi:hypothetical protein